MKPQWQTQLTLPPKEQPYTQSDMDSVLGHPVKLEMNVIVGTSTSLLLLVGRITDAEIQDDGSAVITMEVTTR